MGNDDDRISNWTLATGRFMTHEWTLTRDIPHSEALIGTFDMGNGTTCVSLERLSLAIPKGRYKVTLTVSERASSGSLWSPYPDDRLPLLNEVQGRSGIRIHAANKPSELLGCIATGASHTDTAIQSSRPTVIRIVNELRHYEELGDDVWLTVRSQA